MNFKGDIIITDPCYLDLEDKMHKLNHIKEYTVYGDWSCTTFNVDTKEPIGEFCADGGKVGVFLLDEVLKYNPNFNYHTERKWTTTLIPNFDGEIEIVYNSQIDEVEVIGKGNINFITRQTGF